MNRIIMVYTHILTFLTLFGDLFQKKECVENMPDIILILPNNTI